MCVMEDVSVNPFQGVHANGDDIICRGEVIARFIDSLDRGGMIHRAHGAEILTAAIPGSFTGWMDSRAEVCEWLADRLSV
jgi:hypothetical protein